MFFKLVNYDDGTNRVQVTLGRLRRSFTIAQFVRKTTEMLNKLGYEVVKK